ncbi:hypothetical protein ACLBWT_13445 [Paenibacillus sp. D51F]
MSKDQELEEDAFTDGRSAGKEERQKLGFPHRNRNRHPCGFTLHFRGRSVYFQ